MRKAYLKRYSGSYIKGRGSLQPLGYALLEAQQTNAEQLHRGEKVQYDMSGTETGQHGKPIGEVWNSGLNPRRANMGQLRERVLLSQLMMQTDRVQKRQQYNKVVLKSTAESVITMYFGGNEVFLIEDYPDGTYRQSLQTTSTTRMKKLFDTGNVPWL